MSTVNRTASLRIENNIIFLQGVLDFDTVLPLLPLLQNAFRPGNDIVALDLGGISYTNSAGIALLLDAARSQKAATNRDITCQHIPAPMLDIMRMCGLQDVFAIPG